MQPKKMYILSECEQPVEILSDIVKHQDCDAYQDWIGTVKTSSYIAYKCPWNTPFTDPIGRFSVNGVKFNIPREYLWLDSRHGKTLNGSHNTLFIAFVYPDLSPVTAKEWSSINTKEIHLNIINSSCPSYLLEKPISCNRFESSYDVETHMNFHEDHKSTPQFVRHDNKLNLDVYNWHLKTFVKKGFYVRGDVWRPNYWMHCIANYCDAHAEYITDKIYITFNFNQDELLARHDEVHKRIIELLDSWRVQDND
jgi:hypothetical protein